MNNLKYKYLIFEGINDLEYLLVDRVRKVISNLKDGKYNNITKECEKIYLKDKYKHWADKKMGYSYIKCLITGDKNLTLSKVILETNDLKEFDLKCMEIKKEQLEGMIRRLEHDKECLLKNEQYYTYAFSNLDHTISEYSLDNKYFTAQINKENTLEEIIRPGLYGDKEEEYTILDEEYDLGTTFYYIDEIKNDYDKFMKFLSETIIVKEIFKDGTLIVGISEFVNSHIKELNNIFGKQTEEVYIENLIKMIDGNATESCYKDFNKEFKLNYKFMFCNNNTFEKIKEQSIEELDYEKVYELAIIENKEANVSAYLGVYNNQFQLIYNIHSKENYKNNFMRLKSIPEIINMEDIKNSQDLEIRMKHCLEVFYNNNSKNIEILSKRLDEDEQNIEEEETEEMEG